MSIETQKVKNYHDFKKTLSDRIIFVGVVFLAIGSIDMALLALSIMCFAVGFYLFFVESKSADIGFSIYLDSLSTEQIKGLLASEEWYLDSVWAARDYLNMNRPGWSIE